MRRWFKNNFVFVKINKFLPLGQISDSYSSTINLVIANMKKRSMT